MTNGSLRLTPGTRTNYQGPSRESSAICTWSPRRNTTCASSLAGQRDEFRIYCIRRLQLDKRTTIFRPLVPPKRLILFSRNGMIESYISTMRTPTSVTSATLAQRIASRRSHKRSSIQRGRIIDTPFSRKSFHNLFSTTRQIMRNSMLILCENLTSPFSYCVICDLLLNKPI